MEELPAQSSGQLVVTKIAESVSANTTPSPAEAIALEMGSGDFFVRLNAQGRVAIFIFGSMIVLAGLFWVSTLQRSTLSPTKVEQSQQK